MKAKNVERETCYVSPPNKSWIAKKMKKLKVSESNTVNRLLTFIRKNENNISGLKNIFIAQD